MMLGAILAGGQARRFGRDKAVVDMGGVRLIDRIAARLSGVCDRVIVCGRTLAGYDCVPDRPAPHLGPLGGIAAALRFATDAGYTTVLTVPCDVPDVPVDLVLRLAPAPAVVSDCPVIGLWPVSLADRLDAFLAGSDDRSLRAWARACDARFAPALGLANINRPDDLAAYLAR